MDEEDVENLIDCYPNARVYTEVVTDSYDKGMNRGICKEVLPLINLDAVINYQGDSDSFTLLMEVTKPLWKVSDTIPAPYHGWAKDIKTLVELEEFVDFGDYCPQDIIELWQENQELKKRLNII